MLKRWTALLLCLVFLGVCAAAEAVDVTGEWYLTLIESSGVSMNPADMGMEMVMSLNADGTGAVAINGQEDQEAAWTLEGDVLTVTVGEEAEVFTVVDGDMIYSEVENGPKTVLGRERPVPGFVPAGAVKAEDLAAFDGEWTAYYADLFGMVVDAEAMAQMGLTETGISIENGSILKFGEETAQVGTLEDGVLVVSSDAEGDGASLMSTTVTLLEDGTLAMDYLGMRFYCMKVD